MNDRVAIVRWKAQLDEVEQRRLEMKRRWQNARALDLDTTLATPVARKYD
jgi:hypothetical protein